MTDLVNPSSTPGLGPQFDPAEGYISETGITLSATNLMLAELRVISRLLHIIAFGTVAPDQLTAMRCDEIFTQIGSGPIS